MNVNSKIYLTFRALQHRNYRLFFFGQCISLTGTWIQQIAISWLVYTLTKSALLMGIITFAGSIPSLVVSPFAGVFIDRINKYHALVIIQVFFMIEAFILAILTITGIINIWYIIILGVFIGITNAIDMPLRQSFIIQLVEDSRDLGNAISLNSSMFNLARLIGPAIAGVLIALVGEGICFLINAVSYIAVIWALLAMKINSVTVKKTAGINIFQEFNEGFKYVLNSMPIRNIILYMATASFAGMSYMVILPIFAKEIIHGDSQTLGFLMSSSGIGALFGALYLASKKSVSGLEKWICIASLLFGAGLIGLAFTAKVWISLILMLIIGFGTVTVIASCNTLIQHFVDDNKRGRVMSLYTVAFMGTAPFGCLCEGAVANKIGVPFTFLLNGLIIIIAALIFSTKLKCFSAKPESIELNDESSYAPVH